MRRATEMMYVSAACCVAIIITSTSEFCVGQSGITFSQVGGQHEVRYVSGTTVYIEKLLKDRWVGSYWGAEDSVDQTNQGWDNDAFEIRIKDESTPPTMPGTLLSSGWRWVSASELPKTDRGARHCVVELSSTTLPITVRVHTLLDGTPVMTRYLEVTNTSNKSLALTAVYPWSGRLWSGEAAITLGHSTRWEEHWEGWFGWTVLNPGTNVIEENRGLAYDDPYFILHNESRGEYFFGQLAWPANYQMEFQQHRGLSFKIGPTAVDALRVIARGETVTTPAVHLSYVKGDFDSSVQAMHQHIRRSVLPTFKSERSYLIEYLMPADTPNSVYLGDEVNEANVKKLMDVAAAVGLETFILDGPLWASSYGNWLAPNKERFPRGLTPLAKYAHQKGLLFGLYAEPEGGRDGYTSHGATIGSWSDSDVLMEHPQWFVQPNDVLNLSIPEAATYFESELNQIVDHYGLDLYRHDFNSPLRGEGSETIRDGFVESDYWRYYGAFYGAFERVHAKHPSLILQQASAGGTRLELATTGVFLENFASDRTRFPFVYRMLSGLSVFLPPEIVVNSNGMAYPEHMPDLDTTLREGTIFHYNNVLEDIEDMPDLDTTLRGAFALGNTPMIFNALLPKSVEELKPEIREKFLHYANLYKGFIRPILPTCNVYHLAPVNATGGVETGDWFAMEFTSPERSKGWAVVIHLSKSEPGTYVFKPKGLDKHAKYSVTFDNSGKTIVLEGSSLMRDGLVILLATNPASELLVFEEI